MLGRTVTQSIDVIVEALQLEEGCTECILWTTHSEEEERLIHPSIASPFSFATATQRVTSQLNHRVCPSITVRQASLSHCSLLPDVRLLSRSSSFFPYPLATGGWDKLGAATQSSLVAVAVHIEHVLRSLDCHDDIHAFSLGSNALNIAEQLCHIHGKHVSPGTRASVVLFDRLLDVVGPASHSDNMADRIFASHDAHDGFSDVRVSLQPLAGSSSSRLPCGRIVHPFVPQTQDFLRGCIAARQKVGISECF